MYVYTYARFFFGGVYVSACVHACVCIYMCTCMCMRVGSTLKYMYVCMYVCDMNANMYVYTCVEVYLRMYVCDMYARRCRSRKNTCMYRVFMYECIHTCPHVHTQCLCIHAKTIQVCMHLYRYIAVSYKCICTPWKTQN
jgi:hypothetical protein